MKRTRTVFVASLSLGSLSAALGFGLDSIWLGSLGAMLLGGLWFTFHQGGRNWFAHLGLGLFAALGAVGIWMNTTTFWMILSVAATVVAWDLQHYLDQLQRSGARISQADPTERHLRRLLLIQAGALLLASTRLLIDLRLGFWPAVLLGVLMFMGINLLMRTRQRET